MNEWAHPHISQAGVHNKLLRVGTLVQLLQEKGRRSAPRNYATLHLGAQMGRSRGVHTPRVASASAACSWYVVQAIVTTHHGSTTAT
eukprot:gene147-2029_t